MKTFIVISLLTLCYSCKTPNASNGKLKKGTTLLTFIEVDSIVMGADSRAESVNVNMSQSSFSDTTHKIFKMGKYFCEISGFLSIRNIPTKVLVKRIFNSSRLLKTNSKEISEKIGSQLQSYFNVLTDYEKKYQSKFKGRPIVSIIIAGYENNKPIVSAIEFGLKNDPKFIVDTRPVFFTSSINEHICAGENDHIASLLNNHYPMSSNRLNDLFGLISLESRYHADVDSKITYVIIKRNGYRAGQNY